ncbi:MAG: CHAP domain-containing protein [Hyphomonadaceae bacterium]|nr:CHAP domain-containing protein [Hyphomonadaceae bacterium]
MVGCTVIRQRLRALGAAFVCAAVAACAATPAPVIGVAAGPAAPPAWSSDFPFSPEAPPRILDSGSRLQCVPYARRVSGVEIYGNANTWWVQAAGRYPRSSLPAPGAVMVTKGYRDASRGHVAVVTEVVTSRIVRVDHANWLNQGEISVGVPVMDVSPTNDWSQVRVWHVPGGHWGGRVYEVEGFIHAFAAPTSSS